MHDLVIHAIGQGFLFSMVIAHTPVILPSITGNRIAYSHCLYFPVAVLHASMVWRMLGSQSLVALGNSGAIAPFFPTVLVHLRRRIGPDHKTTL